MDNCLKYIAVCVISIADGWKSKNQCYNIGGGVYAWICVYLSGI